MPIYIREALLYQIGCFFIHCIKVGEGAPNHPGNLYCKQISLPINCSILKLFPEGVASYQTTHSQCSRRASVSTVWMHCPRHRIISYHIDCDTSWLQLENKSMHFSANIVFAKLPLQDLLPAFGTFFLTLSLFSESIQIH